jgi:hypothetical protein
MGIGVAAVAVSSGTGPAYVTGPNDTGFQNYPGYAGDLTGSTLIDGHLMAVQSDTTYTGYRNLGSWGQIGIPSQPVHNVTFNGCLWEAMGTNAPAVMLRTDGSVTFNYCTIRPFYLSDGTGDQTVDQTAGYQYGLLADGSQAFPGTYDSFAGGPTTLSHCDIWGFANASKTRNSTLANPLVYDYCWVHNARKNTNGQDHTDGIGSPAGGTAAYITINGCRVESTGNTQAIAYENTPGPSSWAHFTVTNNLFAGFGYTINITGGTDGSPDGGSNIIFTDNTFSTSFRPVYGPMYSMNFPPSNNGNLWRRNRWLVPEGAAWGNAGNSGKFWIPNASQIIGSDDSPYVSAVDYAG